MFLVIVFNFLPNASVSAKIFTLVMLHVFVTLKVTSLKNSDLPSCISDVRFPLRKGEKKKVMNGERKDGKGRTGKHDLV
jgi:hypothetical protein